MALFLSVAGWSYIHALTAPGTDGVGVRSVEWLRDHGGNGIVSTVERWWYAHHQPPKGGPPPAVLVHPAPAAGQSTTAPTHPTSAASAASADLPPLRHLPPPPPIVPFASPAVAGEGVWHPVGRLVRGAPAVYATALRPDPVHTSLATGVAWMDPNLVRTVLFAGIQLPGGSWANEAPVPVAERPALVAAFNSGFKLSGSRGGYYSDGRMVRPLVPGAASLVVDTSGRPTVGAWGRDVTMTPSVASVRQNLALIVDGGAPVPGLDDNARGQWGATLGNRLFVWRSGAGVTRNGALVFAAGNGLSVSSLARVLAAAGAVRAMELDINSEWTRFFSYDSPDPTNPAAVTGTKLTPDMRSSPSLYLEAETRDFYAVLSR
ncbi:MAG: phosphodiester glycosidase family protein [Acidimicrobiia bacterium]|nr:phosphodiester glycosidase family protein [Acidimicrobiia bacterium]